MNKSFFGDKNITKIIGPNGVEVKKIYVGTEETAIFSKYFTITFKYLDTDINTWTTHQETFERGTVIDPTSWNSLINGPVVASSDSNVRKLFTGWDINSTFNLWEDTIITAQYKYQFYITFSLEHATANLSSNNWYYECTELIITADTHYLVNGASSYMTPIDAGGGYSFTITPKTYTVFGNVGIPNTSWVKFELATANTWDSRVAKAYLSNFRYMAYIGGFADETLGNGQYKTLSLNNDTIGRITNTTGSGECYGNVTLDNTNIWSYDESANEAELFSSFFNIEIGNVIYYKKPTTVIWDTEDISKGIAEFRLSNGASDHLTTYSAEKDFYKYDYDVYGLVLLSNNYTAPSGWSTYYYNGKTYYRVLNLKSQSSYEENTCGYENGGTVKIVIPEAIPNPAKNPRTITCHSATNCQWEHETMIAFDGDKISPADGNNIYQGYSIPVATLTCYVGNTSTIRWTNNVYYTGTLSSSSWYTMSIRRWINGATSSSTSPTIDSVTADAEYGVQLITTSPQTSWRCKVSMENITNVYSSFRINGSTSPISQINEQTTYTNAQYNSTVYYVAKAPYGYYIPENNDLGGVQEWGGSWWTIYGNVLLTAENFNFVYDSTSNYVVAYIKPEKVAEIYSNYYTADFTKAVSCAENTNTYKMVAGTGIKAAYIYPYYSSQYNTNHSSLYTPLVNNGVTSKTMPVYASLTFDADGFGNNSIYGFVVLENGYAAPANADWAYEGTNSQGNKVYRAYWISELHTDGNGNYPYRYFPGGKTFLLNCNAVLSETVYPNINDAYFEDFYNDWPEFDGYIYVSIPASELTNATYLNVDFDIWVKIRNGDWRCINGTTGVEISELEHDGDNIAGSWVWSIDAREALGVQFSDDIDWEAGYDCEVLDIYYNT